MSQLNIADIHQWRRKIHTNKTRTMVNLPALAVELDESDDLRPPTPKRRLKPKLSSYFDKTSKPVTSPEDHNAPHLPRWPFDQVYPEPKPEEEMDAIMCHLMAKPYSSLDVHFNASLMRVFESYLTLKDGTDRLQRQCDEALATAEAVVTKLHTAEKDWEDEKRDYKEEVKRLEVLLSRTSTQGVAAVTLARQESKLHRRRLGRARKKETVFEFLEKTTKRHDNNHTSWSNQRATMKPLLQSNSDQDLNISRQLAQKKSMINIHADLPFGTPPAKDMRFSLTNMSMLDQQAGIQGCKRPTDESSTTDDDTFSAFSCAGDWFPDEISMHQVQADHVNEDHDMADIESIAIALARRRGVAPSEVMPQLLGLFGANANGIANRTCSMPNALGNTVPEQSATMKTLTSGIVKRATLMTKNSGFFQKKSRPQLAVDTAATDLAVSRRFSFEPGDDVVVQSVAAPGPMASPDESKSRPRSASICSMQSRTQSRIPTPIRTPGAAQPRREREESMSSFLTAFKCSEGGNSRTSSVHSVCRDESIKASPCKDSLYQPRSRKSNRLLDHTNDLRGSGSRDGGPDQKRSSARSTPSGRGSLPDMVNDAQRENMRPTDSDGRPT